MKNLIVAFILLFSGSLFAQPTQPFAAGGGPDTWGYTWKSDQAPNGPTFQWVDITSTGTQITGLGDDNFVGPIPMGINFTYYWNTYNEIYVGSNGFISFGSGFNYASGQNPAFPNFPFSGDAGKNNIIAPMLADLTFTQANGAPVPGAGAYYQTIGDSFIISFVNVPFWSSDSDALPGQYKGLNTFQIILNAADSSITINYLTNQCCVHSSYVGTNMISRGMEDVTGTMGLDFDGTTEFYVADSSVIKITPPATPQTSVSDLAVNWVINPDNGAGFVIYDGTGTNKADFAFNIKNVGTVDMTATDTAIFHVEYREPLTQTIIFQQDIILQGLAKGMDTTFTLSGVLPTNKKGSYMVKVLRVGGTNGGNFTDVNPQNNLLSGEIVSVDTLGLAVLGYDDKNWQGEDLIGLGAGIYIEPPYYPAKMQFIEFDARLLKNPANRSNVIIEIYKNDGPNGSIGTKLDSIFLDINNFLQNVQPGDTVNLSPWVALTNGDSSRGVRFRVPIPSKATLNNPGDGVYIAYLAQDNASLGFPTTLLITDNTPPFSHRTYEIIGGIWAPYRDAANNDFALRLLIGTNLTVGLDNVTSSTIQVYPNPVKETLNLRLNGQQGTFYLYNLQGQLIKTLPAQPQIPLGDLPQGMYIYKIQTANTVHTGKIIKQ